MRIASRMLWGEDLTPSECYSLYPGILTLELLLGGKSFYGLTWTIFGGTVFVVYNWRDPLAPAIEYTGFTSFPEGPQP